MFLRTLLGGIVALPILMAGAAQARDVAGNAPTSSPAPVIAFSMPSLRLPGATQPATRSDPVQYAQVTDPRVAQLEEQVRQLTGTLEELNFQILQMQDQLRRMQEDNELRFQELEQKRSDAGGASPTRDRATADTSNSAGGSGDDEYYAAAPRVEDSSEVRGTPPRTFGTITFDENGNAIGGGLPEQTEDDTTVAALPSGSGGDDELYRNSYEFILSGDYGTAETGFRDLLAQYPDSEHAADAHFWLGEALLAQEKPREAAEIFLAASRDYPEARKAPDTLFKLGVSLAALNQRDVACATFTEVLQRYPNTTDALRERIKQEQALASC
ncbi:MAG: tol-pal system protein YbgF [Aquamicrobium sp.]|nr:tol-pal system protein YbgF [Aquamicrobium sp.]